MAVNVIGPNRQFAEFGRDVLRRPATFGDSHSHVARFLKCRCPRVDEKPGARISAIEFPLRRPA